MGEDTVAPAILAYGALMPTEYTHGVVGGAILVSDTFNRND